MKVNCKFCDRFLMNADGTTIVQGLVCANSKCKAKLNIKVIFADDCTEKQLNHKFTEQETPPKEKK